MCAKDAKGKKHECYFFKGHVEALEWAYITYLVAHRPPPRQPHVHLLTAGSM